MSGALDTSSLPYIIIAILTGIGGYLTRRIEKRDEHRDDVHLTILPAVLHYANSFVEALRIYTDSGDFDEFKRKVDYIVKNLREQISSGEIILAKIESSRVQRFYWNLEYLKGLMDWLGGKSEEDGGGEEEEEEDGGGEEEEEEDGGGKDKEDLKRELHWFFSEDTSGYDWIKLNKHELIEDADYIKDKANKRIQGYRSFSFYIIILILVGAVLAGLANYISAAIEDQGQGKENGNSQSEESEKQPVFLNTSDGHYYEAIAGDITWSDAKIAAEQRTYQGLRGHLATINSQEEQDFIVNNLPQVKAPRVYPYGAGYWLGGFQPSESTEPNAGWQWITDEEFTFTRWMRGEPNNKGGDEDSLAFWSQPGNETGREELWNDVPNSFLAPGYIVEYEPGDLEVVSTSAVQAPLDPATVVEGKPTVTKTTIKSTFTKKENVDIKITALSGANYNKTIILPIDPGEKDYFLPINSSITPSNAETFQISIELDSRNMITESNEGNNLDFTAQYPIKVTRGLKILYVPLRVSADIDSGPRCGPELTALIKNSEQFFDSVFPLNPSEVHHDVECNLSTIDVGSLHHAPKYSHPYLEKNQIDRIAKNLQELAWMRGYDHVVVLTRDGWLEENTLFDGETFPIAPALALDAASHLKVVLAEANELLGPTIAHEIAHIYDVMHTDLSASGYWVSRGLPTSRFPNSDGVGVKNLMSAGQGSRDQVDIWTNFETFDYLSRKLEVTNDVPIIGISGIMFANDTAQFVTTKKFNSLSDIDLDNPGKYKLIYYDKNNITLAQTGFDLGFSLPDPIGLPKFDSTPFAVRIPSVEGTEKILLKSGAQTLALCTFDGSECVNNADIIDPTITVPGRIAVNTTGNFGSEVSYEVSAVDNGNGTASLECLPPSGSLFPIGDNVVSCSASDAAGNNSTASFVISVSVLPNNITSSEAEISSTMGSQDSTRGYRNWTTGNVIDKFSWNTQDGWLTQGRPSDTAKDSDVLHDTRPPEISIPDNITKEVSGQDGAIVSFGVSAKDNVDARVDVTCDHVSGDTFPIGQTLITCTAKDLAGNTAEESFTTTVQDTTLPKIEIIKAVDKNGIEITEGSTMRKSRSIEILFEAIDLTVGIDKTECSLDQRAFTSCMSPIVYNKLRRGVHEVTIRAIDSAGNIGEDQFTWTVK